MTLAVFISSRTLSTKKIENMCTLNFRMPKIFGVIYLKKRQNLKDFPQKDANGIANSEDPDQTAPLGAI